MLLTSIPPMDPVPCPGGSSLSTLRWRRRPGLGLCSETSPALFGVTQGWARGRFGFDAPLELRCLRDGQRGAGMGPPAASLAWGRRSVPTAAVKLLVLIGALVIEGTS